MIYQHEREGDRVRPVTVPMPPLAENLWDVFAAYLVGQELNPNLAVQNQWYPSDAAGDSEPRVVMPATNSAGVPYWQARAMSDAEKRYQSPPVARLDSVIVVWPARSLRFPVVALTDGADAASLLLSPKDKNPGIR